MAKTIYDRLLCPAAGLMNTFKNPAQMAYQTQTRAADGGGGFTTTWATGGTINCVILPASASETSRYDRLETEVTHKIYVLHADGSAITTKDRILFDGRYFNIVEILNLGEADIWVKMMAKEGVAT